MFYWKGNFFSEVFGEKKLYVSLNDTGFLKKQSLSAGRAMSKIHHMRQPDTKNYIHGSGV